MQEKCGCGTSAVQTATKQAWTACEETRVTLVDELRVILETVQRIGYTTEQLWTAFEGAKPCDCSDECEKSPETIDGLVDRIRDTANGIAVRLGDLKGHIS